MTARTRTPEPTRTRHTCGGPHFGRLTDGCPRCEELKAGAAPRPDYARRRASADADSLAALHDHLNSARHRTGQCGPVCTYGEW